MRVEVQGGAVAGTPAVGRHVEQRALFEFARYGECVDAVRVRVTERPPEAKYRYHCGLVIEVRHDDGSAGHVLARSEGDEPLRLIDTVLARASSQLGGEIERVLAAREARDRWLALAAASAGRGS